MRRVDAFGYRGLKAQGLLILVASRSLSLALLYAQILRNLGSLISVQAVWCHGKLSRAFCLPCIFFYMLSFLVAAYEFKIHAPFCSGPVCLPRVSIAAYEFKICVRFCSPPVAFFPSGRLCRRTEQLCITKNCYPSTHPNLSFTSSRSSSTQGSLFPLPLSFGMPHQSPMLYDPA